MFYRRNIVRILSGAVRKAHCTASPMWFEGIRYIYILPVLVDCLMIEVRLLDMQDEWLLLEHLLYLVT